MKKILILVTVIFSSISSTNALSSEEIDASKNLFNPNTIVFEDSVGLVSNTPITIADSGYYTISIPRGVEVTYIKVQALETLFEGEPYYLEECEATTQKTFCTFHIPYNDMNISFTIDGLEVQHYYESYSLLNFQLEKGEESTDYIPWFLTIDKSITIDNSEVYTSEYSNTISALDIVNSTLTANDEIDGDVTNSITIVEDSYTSNIGTLGEYPIVVEAKDSNQNKSRFQINVKIEDHTKPQIIGDNRVDVYISSSVTIEDIVQNYQGIDEYDGETDIVVITDQYSENANTVGSYIVVLETTDSSNNRYSKSIIIDVSDQTPPTITSSMFYNSKMSNPLSLTDILDSIVVSDNYYYPEQISIDVISDDFSLNKYVEGSYVISVRITDPSLNMNQYNLTVTVTDDIAPIIEGVNQINVSYDEQKDITYFKEQLSVTDNVSNISYTDLIVEIDDYTTNSNVPGGYRLKFSVTDNAGNISYKTIIVAVIDQVAPEFTYDTNTILVNNKKMLSKSDIINELIEQRIIEKENYHVEVLMDTYTENQSKPGTYLYQVKLSDDQGIENIQTIEIEVVESKIQEYSSMISNNTLLVLKNTIIYSSSIAILGIITYKVTKKK